jgi:hypothetical protein
LLAFYPSNCRLFQKIATFYRDGLCLFPAKGSRRLPKTVAEDGRKALLTIIAKQAASQSHPMFDQYQQQLASIVYERCFLVFADADTKGLFEGGLIVYGLVPSSRQSRATASDVG